MTDLPVEHPLHGWAAAAAYSFGPLTGASALLVNGGGLWVGIIAEETTGLAPARLVVGDGNASGVQNAAMPFTFAANESRADFWPGHGMLFQTGLVVTATAGTVGGAILVALLDRDQLHRLQALRAGRR